MVTSRHSPEQICILFVDPKALLLNLIPTCRQLSPYPPGGFFFFIENLIIIYFIYNHRSAVSLVVLALPLEVVPIF